MSITRDRPHETVYQKYGDPYRLVEFRMFVLNKCGMSCKGCFYDRDSNDFADFPGALRLATEMLNAGYKMETCYLLPTDIFENSANYTLMDDPVFVEVLSKFSYVGLAATLEDGYDATFLDRVLEVHPAVGIELQVNLLLTKLKDLMYLERLQYRIHDLKHRYGDRIAINLAINTGFVLSEEEIRAIGGLISELSEDGIVEINFTFLYNPKIKKVKKREMLIKSIATVNAFSAVYAKDDSFSQRLNDRTFLRKPAFSFLGGPNRVYATPILPFDEYVFLENDRYQLTEPSYDGFLTTYNETLLDNDPVTEECYSCPELSHCLGKHYFNIANDYDLGCHKLIR